MEPCGGRRNLRKIRSFQCSWEKGFGFAAEEDGKIKELGGEGDVDSSDKEEQ